MGSQKAPAGDVDNSFEFFPPHPPCIIGMRYADVPGETLVLAKLARSWFGTRKYMHCEGAGEPTQIGVNSKMERMRLRIKRSRIRIHFLKIQVWIFKPKFKDQDQGSGQESRNKDQEVRGRIKGQSFLYEYKIRSLLNFNLSWAPGE